MAEPARAPAAERGGAAPSPRSVYRLFRRGSGEAPAMRSVILAMLAVAIALTAIGLVRVSRRHEVLRLGYELSRKTEQVRKLRATQRELELELATLSAPARIEHLATRLGMTRVAPDRIRTVRRRAVTPRRARRAP